MPTPVPTPPDTTRGAYLDPRTGARIEWWMTTDHAIPSCPLCAEGQCEQRVERCAAWDADLVIHGRPVVLQ